MAAPGIRVVQAGEGAAAADAAPGSVLAQLRSQAKAQRETKTLDIAIGGDFEDNLIVRYGLLPVDELDRYVELQAKGGGLSNLKLGIEMCVASCRTFLYRIDGQDTDLNVKIDGGLWELMDWPLPDGIESTSELMPREIMLALFGNNALALGTHVGQVFNWMQNPGATPPGEASAATS